jgi:hypothetical protein
MASETTIMLDYFEETPAELRAEADRYIEAARRSNDPAVQRRLAARADALARRAEALDRTARP